MSLASAKNWILSALAVGLAFCPLHVRANAIIRSGTGFTPAELAGVLDQFHADLGGADHGASPGPFADGFRSLTWDVPDNLASPNPLPGDYYNSLSPRGVVFESTGTFLLSADSSNPSMTPVLFGDIDASYSSVFQPFMSERVFTVANSTTVDLDFFLPSDPSTRAWVKGLGAVFSSVDSPLSTSMEFFDDSGVSLGEYFAPAATLGGLSFLGVAFDAGERVGSVRINAGNAPLGPGVIDGGVVDLVTMAHIVFGEPVPEPAVWGLALLGGFLLMVRKFPRCREANN